MLSVLLVDDEYILLKGLETMLLDHDKTGLKVYTAGDGAEALQLMPKIRPDVVIADLNMPELDGLSMIERIIQEGYGCKFIIASGYEKLEYFKHAVQYQVVDYLVKPIDKAKLLQKIDMLHEEKIRQLEMIQLKLKVCFLQQGFISDSQLNRGEMDRLFPYPFTSLSVFTHRDFSGHKAAVCNLLSNYVDHYVHISLGNRQLFFFNNNTPIKEEDIQGIWSLCKEGIQDFGILIFPDKEDFAEALLGGSGAGLYYQALCRMIWGRLAKNDDVPPLSHPDSDMKSFQLLNGIKAGNGGLEPYIAHLHSFSENFDGLFLAAFIQSSAYGSLYDDQYPLAHICDMFCYYRKFTVDTASLENMVREVLHNKWTPAAESGKEKKPYSHKIYQAVLYIQQYYSEDLSLGSVARKVELNSSYFSNSFKREVGLSFLQYLHECRIKAACTLLQNNSHISMEKVAEKVGYRSTTYFHKIFRTHLGLSPSQWREGRHWDNPAEEVGGEETKE